MEDDIDIYADLPNISLKSDEEKNVCNCGQLTEQLNSLTSKLENIQKINETLESNLSSLLKTAKAEIARKDRMIDDLRKRLDNGIFRRNNGQSSNFSDQKSYQQNSNVNVEKFKDTISLKSSEESGPTLHQFESHNEYTNAKSQSDDSQTHVTIFAERLHKKIMKAEKEERKQKALLKFNDEGNTKKMLEERVIESDKENGSHSIANKNDNESHNVVQNYSLASSSQKGSVEKENCKNDNGRNKRLKIEDNEDKIMTEESNYNGLMQCEVEDNRMQSDVKYNLTKFENPIDTEHYLKGEKISFGMKRKFSEHEETQVDQYHTNARKEERSTSKSDYNSCRNRQGSIDNLKNSRCSLKQSSTSENPNNNFRSNDNKKSYKSVSPNSKHYSRKKNDYERSNSYREKSNKTYRNKYGDYISYSRYKNYELKKDYICKESGNNKDRYNSREHSNSRDRFRYSSDVEGRESREHSNPRDRFRYSSDVEGRESRNNSYKTNKYDSHKLKVAARSLSNKNLHDKFGVADIDSRIFSNETTVNTIANPNTNKNDENLKINNKSNIQFMSSKERTDIVNNTYKNLEEGEIIDSPNCSPRKKISKNEKINNDIDIVPIKNKDKESFGNLPKEDGRINLQDNIILTKRLEKLADSNEKGSQGILSFPQVNSKIMCFGEIMQLNPVNKSVTSNEVRQCNNDDMYKSRSDKSVMNFISENITNEQVCNSDVSDKSYTEQILKNLTIEDSIKTQTNNFINDGISIIPSENSENFTTKIIGVNVPNCDIKDNTDESAVPIKIKTSNQILNGSNVQTSRTCLIDHNYIRQSPESTNIESNKPVSDTLKISKAEEKIKSHPSGIKKMTSSTMKYKKDEESKMIVVSRRRKAVTLSDSNASMTMLMNMNEANGPAIIDNSTDNDSTLKPRACKLMRMYKSAM